MAKPASSTHTWPPATRRPSTRRWFRSNAMALKICHLDTERSWRGGEQQLIYLAEGLRKAGDENIIAARPESELAKRARESGFDLLPVRPWSEWAPLAAWS